MRDLPRLDRRGATKGDVRRSALLAALDEQLREGQRLEEINVAEISRRAGVTRSAFYFYFESKATAVASLLDDFYEEVAEATETLVAAEGDPEERVGKVVAGLFDAVDQQPHTFRALLEARATSPAVREVWEDGRAEFARMVAGMIIAERRRGHAPPGAQAKALAAVLLDLNDHALERHAQDAGPPRARHIEALTSIWVRTIYGRSDA
jgi:TetR/AcrR family transcriptional regulator, ethionamide resistance regulator